LNLKDYRQFKCMCILIYTHMYIHTYLYKHEFNLYIGLKDEQNLVKLFILNLKENYQFKIQKSNANNGDAHSPRKLWRQ
jgi:hypothetical protein